MTRSTSRRLSKPPSDSSNQRSRRAEDAPLRRGFKAAAERQAAEIRAPLGVTHRDRLDPFRLADHLRIKVVPLSALEQVGLSKQALHHLLRRNSRACSGFYMRETGCASHIFFNDSHALTRQASDITHECAHDILGHEPTEVFDGLGCRRWNPVQEAEVNYLAPALLVAREGILWAMRQGMSEEDAAEHFGVSGALFRMRANLTGATAQLTHERRLYARRRPRA